jgi:hypothetical protein
MTTANIGIRSGNTVIPYAPGSMMPAGTVISYTGALTDFTTTAAAEGAISLIHKAC